MSTLRLALFGIVVVAATAIGLRIHTVRSLDDPVGGSISVGPTELSSAIDLERPSVGRRAPLESIPDPTPTGSESPDVFSADLVRLLEAVTRAERASDIPRLEVLVGEALSPRHGLTKVLELLAVRGFDQRAEPLAGALTVVALAATLERARGENGDTSRILAEMPVLSETARARLAPLLSGLEVDGRLVLHAQWWPRLLELQRAHPEFVEDFAPLFLNLHRDEPGLQGLAGVLQEAATNVEFPIVVAAAIRGLSVLDPALGFSIASDLRGRSDLSLELERELARLAATLLPPAEAVDALSGQSRAIAMQGMLVLGDRPEAGEALRQKYNDLTLSPGTERDRMNVISGMRHEESQVLLGIAQTDASVRVREQALLMLTSSRSVETATVQALHALRHAGSDSIGARFYTSALANVVVRSGGEAREEALQLLRGVADDPAASDAERGRAAEILAKHTPSPGESNPSRSSSNQAEK